LLPGKEKKERKNIFKIFKSWFLVVVIYFMEYICLFSCYLLCALRVLVVFFIFYFIFLNTASKHFAVATFWVNIICSRFFFFLLVNMYIFNGSVASDDFYFEVSAVAGQRIERGFYAAEAG